MASALVVLGGDLGVDLLHVDGTDGLDELLELRRGQGVRPAA